jgi:group I intron endonuclease
MSTPIYHYIYKTTNNINGKYYLGMRSTNKDPWNDPYLGSGKFLIKSIKKYGKENFNKEILGFYETREELALIESLIVSQEIVDDRNSYNMTTGGFGFSLGHKMGLGKKLSKEHIKNISLSKSGKNNPNFGKPRSEETKRKMSKPKNSINMHGPKSELHKLKLSNSLKGHYVSDDTKRKISISNTGKKQSPETIQKRFCRGVSEKTREKLSLAGKNRKHSEESKKKMKESWKLRKQKPNPKIAI